MSDCTRHSVAPAARIASVKSAFVLKTRPPTEKPSLVTTISRGCSSAAHPYKRQAAATAASMALLVLICDVYRRRLMPAMVAQSSPSPLAALSRRRPSGALSAACFASEIFQNSPTSNRSTFPYAESSPNREVLSCGRGNKELNAKARRLPWLDPIDERHDCTKREILGSYAKERLIKCMFLA